MQNIPNQVSLSDSNEEQKLETSPPSHNRYMDESPQYPSDPNELLQNNMNNMNLENSPVNIEGHYMDDSEYPERSPLKPNSEMGNYYNNNYNPSIPNPIPNPMPHPKQNSNNYETFNPMNTPPNKFANNFNEESNVSFKPRNMEVYDSSQEYPAGEGQMYESSGTGNSISSTKKARMNSNELSGSYNMEGIIQIIGGLSNSVKQMVNKIEKFKINIDERMNKLEAEITLIKNKQNFLEGKINTIEGGYNKNNNVKPMSKAHANPGINMNRQNSYTVLNTMSNINSKLSNEFNRPFLEKNFVYDNKPLVTQGNQQSSIAKENSLYYNNKEDDYEKGNYGLNKSNTEANLQNNNSGLKTQNLIDDVATEIKMEEKEDDTKNINDEAENKIEVNIEEKQEEIKEEDQEQEQEPEQVQEQLQDQVQVQVQEQVQVQVNVQEQKIEKEEINSNNNPKNKSKIKISSSKNNLNSNTVLINNNVHIMPTVPATLSVNKTDIDKLIETSERRFLETQKLLEHYGSNPKISKNK